VGLSCPNVSETLWSLFSRAMASTEMPLKTKTIVFPKRRDNSPTPGGDILENVVNSATGQSLRTPFIKFYFNMFHQSLKSIKHNQIGRITRYRSKNSKYFLLRSPLFFLPAFLSPHQIMFATLGYNYCWRITR
jgi:hypothetical protein